VAVVTRRTICSFVSQRSGSVAIGPTDSRLLADAFCASGPNLSCPDSVCVGGDQCPLNHDLPEATVATCESTATVQTHGTPQFQEYTSLNSTLDGIIEFAKRTLHVRLLGDALPAASHLEDLIAAWGVSAAREAVWDDAELLWHLRQAPPLSSVSMDALDGLTTVTNKASLVPVP
jgi:hypothetical protein